MGYFRGLHRSLQHMRGEEQTDNFLVDLLIFLTLLIQLNGGIHGPIEDETHNEEEAASEDEGEFKKEICEAGCECSSCLDKKATSEAVPEVVATETVPEATSQQPKNELKAAPVADKHEECCVIS